MIGKRIGVVLPTVLVALLLAQAPAQARHHKRRVSAPAAAGSFDYYVLSLSWSPQHCATAERGSDLQCGMSRHYGFVLHGLWPQNESGYPESCATEQRVSGATVERMLDVMPSPELVRHEWSKHGACSGLTADAYFAAARGAFTAVKIPVPYDAPVAGFRTSVNEIEQAFQLANPRLAHDRMAVLCKGKFLQEIRICLDKDFHARVCGRDVRDGCREDVVVRPVR